MKKKIFKMIMPTLMALSLAGVGFSSYVFSGETGNALLATIDVASVEPEERHKTVFTTMSITSHVSMSQYGFAMNDGTFSYVGNYVNSQSSANGAYLTAAAVFNPSEAAPAISSLDENGTLRIDAKIIYSSAVKNYLSITGTLNSYSVSSKQEANSDNNSSNITFDLTGINKSSTAVGLAFNFVLSAAGNDDSTRQTNYANFYNLYKSSGTFKLKLTALEA